MNHPSNFNNSKKIHDTNYRELDSIRELAAFKTSHELKIQKLIFITKFLRIFLDKKIESDFGVITDFTSIRIHADTQNFGVFKKSGVNRVFVLSAE